MHLTLFLLQKLTVTIRGECSASWSSAPSVASIAKPWYAHNASSYPGGSQNLNSLSPFSTSTANRCEYSFSSIFIYLRCLYLLALMPFNPFEVNYGPTGIVQFFQESIKSITSVVLIDGMPTSAPVPAPAPAPMPALALAPASTPAPLPPRSRPTPQGGNPRFVFPNSFMGPENTVVDQMGAGTSLQLLTAATSQPYSFTFNDYDRANAPHIETDINQIKDIGTQQMTTNFHQIYFSTQQPFNQGGFSSALNPVVSGAPTNSTLVGFDMLSMEENLELNMQNQNDHQFHNTYNVNSNRSQDYDSEEEEDKEDAPNMESDDNDHEDSGLNMLLLYLMDYVC